jgi:alpha-tubulin suppressor-like RCC1 family protein
MGNKLTPASADDSKPFLRGRCLYMQGFNESCQCGRSGYPFNAENCVISLVSGMSHSLSVLSTGEFVSWGSNEFGQLGTESESYLAYYLLEPAVVSPVSFPRQLASIRIVSIAAGAWHSACVTAEGEVFAWGRGTDGQLGLEPVSGLLQRKPASADWFCPRPAAVTALSGRNVQQIYCGSNYTIVKTGDCKVFAFGNGSEGVLGNGNTGKTHVLQEIRELEGVKVKKIACGWNHCLALTENGQVFQWGNMLKDIVPLPEMMMFPTPVDGIEAVKDIACGDYHSCALLKSKRLLVWGSNGYGQLGNPEVGSDFVTMNPIEVEIGKVSQVACGGLFMIAKMKNYSVLGWGSNKQRQLGLELEVIVRTPTVLMHSNEDLKRIGCGYSHIFMLSEKPISMGETESNTKDKNMMHYMMKTDHSSDLTAEGRV